MENNNVSQGLQELGATLQRSVEPLRPLIQALQQVYQVVAPVLEAMAPYIERFERYIKFVDSVRATGWLPYHTVSLDYVEECGDDVSLLDNRLMEFYRENWDSIRYDIETRLDCYQISEEAKATFREALSAHDIGHYRSVCCVLFPAIDKEFRVQFFEDTAGLISSRKMLERFKEHVELKDFLAQEAYGWILFDRLIRHLYEPVDDNNRAKYESDYVPNRHASTHGLVSYSTFKHSVNMIVMADYIFQVLTSTAKLTSPQQ